MSALTERFPGGASAKEPACQYKDLREMVSIPDSGRSPAGGQCNPLQHSCLGNLVDRGAQQAANHRVNTESDTTEVI